MILGGNVQNFKCVREYPIYKSEVEGKTVYKIQENDDGKRSDDSVIVKMDTETRDWSPIDSCEKNVDAEEMRRTYGLWKKGMVSRILGKEGIQQNDITSFRNESKNEVYVGSKPYNNFNWAHDDDYAADKREGARNGKLYCYSYLDSAWMRKIDDEWTLQEWYLLNEYSHKK